MVISTLLQGANSSTHKHYFHKDKRIDITTCNHYFIIQDKHHLSEDKRIYQVMSNHYFITQAQTLLAIVKMKH
jgi:hypothetical protein